MKLKEKCPIQTPRLEYKPFKYPKYFEFYNQTLSSVWRPETVDMESDIKDYMIRSSNDEKAIIGDILKGFTMMETIVGDYWRDKVCAMFPHYEIIAAATSNSFFECFDKETELLTANGWKNVQFLQESDLFAQYNLNNKKIDFIKATKIIKYKYEGLMHLYQSKNTDICVTPNHDLITYLPSKNKLDKCKSFERKLGRNYQYPNSGYSNLTDKPCSTLNKLLIAIQADGHLFGLKDSKRLDYVQIKLTKKRKIDKLREYLYLLNIDFKETLTNKNATLFSFSVPNLNTFNIKNLNFLKLEELSNLEAKEIINEIIFWDGSKQGSGMYYNTNEKAVDKVQAIACICGIRAQKGVNRTAKQSLKVTLPQGGSPKTSKTCYVLTFKNQEIDKEYTTYPHRIEKEYNDFVYCISVPSTNIISRRNGKVAITGNCIHQAAYAYLNDSLGLTDYAAFLEDKPTKDKLDFYVAHKSDLVSLAVFSGIGEGVSLFSAFAVLLSLSRNGRYKGLAQIISWSARDEYQHSEMGCMLFKDLVKEKGITKEEETEIYKGFDVGLETEFNFIDNLFCNRTLDSITKDELKDYMFIRANNRLEALGLTPKYIVSGVGEELRSWFSLETQGQSSNDFFWQSLDGGNYTALLTQNFEEFDYSKINLEWND